VACIHKHWPVYINTGLYT